VASSNFGILRIHTMQQLQRVGRLVVRAQSRIIYERGRSAGGIGLYRVSIDERLIAIGERKRNARLCRLNRGDRRFDEFVHQ
jgi:hypothetical protein